MKRNILLYLFFVGVAFSSLFVTQGKHAFAQDRPSLCQSLTLSSKSLSPGQNITITSTAKTSDVRAFYYYFYNLDNLYGPGNPKGIYFTDGVHYGRVDTIDRTGRLSSAHSITITYDEFNKPDMNWAKHYPTNIQVNGYFSDSLGRFSAPAVPCATDFHLVCTPRKVACAGGCGLRSSCTSDGCGGMTCCPATKACCFPAQMSCKSECGRARVCASDGCGGQTCCDATAACATACVDSDGGSAPDVAGKVTISAPALPQTLSDTCMYLKTQTVGVETTSQWIAQATGTHVAEKTCVNTATGQYQDSIIACPKGCTNGACNTTAQCSLRSQGDANCDNAVDKSDYSMFVSAISGAKYTCVNCSADFNLDKKVNVLDFEIWRNTVYK